MIFQLIGEKPARTPGAINKNAHPYWPVLLQVSPENTNGTLILLNGKRDIER